jgi:hypothetical protein
MSPDMIDAMIDAGLTREQMAALLKHELAKQEAAKVEKRAKDAERQRKSRRSRNVTVTPRDYDGQCATPPSLNDPLPNLETSEVSLNPPPYSPPAPKNSRGSRISPDWRPSERNRADAAAIGVPVAMIEPTGRRFRDFWTAKAGKDAVKLDWDATWRNWCSSEAERRGWAPSSPSPTQIGSAQVFVAVGSAEWDAWQSFRGKKLPFKYYPEHQAEGWLFPAPCPPTTTIPRKEEAA